MKQQRKLEVSLNEAKRMQQLAGIAKDILKEGDESGPILQALDKLGDDLVFLKKDLESHFIQNNKKYVKTAYQMSQVDLDEIINKLEDYQQLIKDNLRRLSGSRVRKV
jgi:hypothetical protein